MDGEKLIWQGPDVMRETAKIFWQFYLRPGEEGERRYADAFRRLAEPEDKSLSHFHLSPGDRCAEVTTPAGPVRTYTFPVREDFETFLQILCYRCEPRPIPRTQGASILLNVPNAWKLEHMDDTIRERAAAAGRREEEIDWTAERLAFREDKSNYRDTMIVLSVGPYSNVAADRAGFPEAEWLRLSQLIRTYHECTHYMCRRLYPELVDGTWDEVVADAVGLRAALGRYDAHLAEVFLGLEGDRYAGGRLENYVPKDTADPAAWLAETSRRIHRLTGRITALSDALKDPDPFALGRMLEERKAELWDEVQA